jgi:hypothetical protein
MCSKPLEKNKDDDLNNRPVTAKVGKKWAVKRVNVHNLAQAANWRSLVKMSLELQSCSLFQINRRQKSSRSVTFGHVN